MVIWDNHHLNEISEETLANLFEMFTFNKGEENMEVLALETNREPLISAGISLEEYGIDPYDNLFLITLHGVEKRFEATVDIILDEFNTVIEEHLNSERYYLRENDEDNNDELPF